MRLVVLGVVHRSVNMRNALSIVIEAHADFCCLNLLGVSSTLIHMYHITTYNGHV